MDTVVSKEGSQRQKYYSSAAAEAQVTHVYSRWFNFLHFIACSKTMKSRRTLLIPR